MRIEAAHFILYVSDQSKSRSFYTRVLGLEPRLDVPGMAEFVLNDGAILGLMPEEAIRRLLGPAFPDPSRARGIPRSEVYLLVDRPGEYMERAIAAGARVLSPLGLRSWGHVVAYCLDPDAHVLAFASKS